MKVKIINKSNNPLPKYSTIGSSGMDLRAYTENDITLKPLILPFQKVMKFKSDQEVV